MLFRLFLLFTLVPLVELALLLRIGGLIGFPLTLALVMGTGAAGAYLARREGMRSWAAVQGELAAGRMPTSALLHSLLILLAGVVLVTPGVLTDLAGLALLIQPVRRRVLAGLRRRFERGLEAGTIHVAPLRGGPFWGPPADPEGERAVEADDPSPGRVIEI